MYCLKIETIELAASHMTYFLLLVETKNLRPWVSKSAFQWARFNFIRATLVKNLDSKLHMKYIFTLSLHSTFVFVENLLFSFLILYCQYRIRKDNRRFSGDGNRNLSKFSNILILLIGFHESTHYLHPSYL